MGWRCAQVVEQLLCKHKTMNEFKPQSHQKKKKREKKEKHLAILILGLK
jgi:hypothetical protein